MEFQTLNDPTLIGMLDAANSFCADLKAGTSPRWLSYLGSTGTGKTHLSVRIMAYFEKHCEGRYIPNQDLTKTQYCQRGSFRSWRKISERIRNGDYGIISDLENYHLLIIDDIGSEYKSKNDLVTSKLDQLLDARLGKWTVITANLSLEQIGEFMDVRIASRLMRGGSKIIDVDALDFNLRNK